MKFINKLVNKILDTTNPKFTLNTKSKRILDVFWDYEINPTSFDIVWMLAASSLFANINNYSEIRLFLINEIDIEKRWYPENYKSRFSIDDLLWRKRNICQSVVGLFPLVKNTVINAPREEVINIMSESPFVRPQSCGHWLYYKYINENYIKIIDKQLEKNPLGLIVSSVANNYIKEWAEDYDIDISKSLVVTLREHNVDSSRNNEYSIIQNFIRQHREDFSSVIIVKDTDRGLETIKFPGVFYCDIARFNVELRAALYELAYMNIIVSSGPASLLQINPKTKFILSNIINEKIPPCSSDFHLMKGYVIGKQPVFATNLQQWIWTKESLEEMNNRYNIIRGYDGI